MSLIKDLCEIWQLINQYHKEQKAIKKEISRLEEEENKFWNLLNL